MKRRIVLMLLLIFAGCSVREYEHPTIGKIYSGKLLTKDSLQNTTIYIDPNGVMQVDIGSAKSEGDKAVDVLAGLLKLYIPTPVTP